MQDKTKGRLEFLINLAFYAAIILLVYIGFKYVFSWILPFIIAFCIVSVMNPLIRLVNKALKTKQAIVSTIVLVLMYTLVGFLLFQLIIQLIFLVRDLFTTLPDYYRTSIGPALTRVGENLSALFEQLPPQFRAQIDNLDLNIADTVQNFLSTLSQEGLGALSRFTGRIPSFFIAFAFTIMLSFFISMRYSEVTGFFKAQLPEKTLRAAGELRSIANDMVFRYLKAIFKLMLITFVELSIGLLFLRTNYAIPIAAGIAVFDALPLFGTGAIMIPWVVIELIQGHFTYALGLGILYAVITVVRNLIEPHIVGKKLGLNPIVSVVSIYLGFKLFGVLGMIFMPIVTQIAIELHKRGLIRLFRSPGAQAEKKDPEAEASPSESD